MKLIKIESYLPIFQGFYGSIFECDCEEEYIKEGKTWDDYEWNFADYHNRVAEACVKPIEKELSNFGIKVEFQSLHSPKFYNYTNDSINVEYTLQTDSFFKVIEYLTENLEAFEEHLENNFKSRDGFMSFFNYDSETWFNEYLKLEHERFSTIFGSVLEFILTNEDYTEQDLYDAVRIETNYIGYELKESCE